MALIRMATRPAAPIRRARFCSLQRYLGNGEKSNPIHPLTFKPEFIDAFELGTKNTLLDGSLTFNIAFYYNYKNYQISRIVDRTAINDNFDAHVKARKSNRPMNLSRPEIQFRGRLGRYGPCKGIEIRRSDGSN